MKHTLSNKRAAYKHIHGDWHLLQTCLDSQNQYRTGPSGRSLLKCKAMFFQGLGWKFSFEVKRGWGLCTTRNSMWLLEFFTCCIHCWCGCKRCTVLFCFSAVCATLHCCVTAYFPEPNQVWEALFKFKRGTLLYYWKRIFLVLVCCMLRMSACVLTIQILWCMQLVAKHSV